MAQEELKAALRRVDDRIGIIDIQGEITANVEGILMKAYTQAGENGASVILLNMRDLTHMDGGGLFLLVKLLACARRRTLMAFSLNECYQRVFEMTCLNESIVVYATEADALSGLGAAPEAEKAPPRPTALRNAGYWAASIDTLTPPDTPPEAISLNVKGRRPFGPLQGFGQLWLKTYRIRLGGGSISPEEVISAWKVNFPAFWSGGNRYYGSPRGIVPGETAVLNLSGPGGLPIATGIFVLYADEQSFTFASPEGHILGGWITFSAYREEGETIAQVQALFRGGDLLYELGFLTGLAHKAEDTFWGNTLISLAAHFGVEGEVERFSERLDPRRQWSHLSNVWYNAAVRTVLYMPFHWIGRLFRR